MSETQAMQSSNPNGQEVPIKDSTPRAPKYSKQWRNTKEGNLPEFDKNLLISVDGKVPFVGQLSAVKKGAFTFTREDGTEVSASSAHWMEVPALPTAE